MLLNTGSTPVPSEKGLVTTIGWRLGREITYALEGSVFIAGAAVQWLRDGLKAISVSAEVEALMSEVPDTDGVYLVPAFAGLGAPHWDPLARGLICGATRGTTAAHLARATIESIAFQVRDVFDAMREDGTAPAVLLADGGASRNADLMCAGRDENGSKEPDERDVQEASAPQDGVHAPGELCDSER